MRFTCFMHYKILIILKNEKRKTNEKQQKNPIKNDVPNFDILKFSINFMCELHHKSNLTYRLT